MSTHHYWQQHAPDHEQHEESAVPIVATLTALGLAFLLMITIFLIAAY